MKIQKRDGRLEDLCFDKIVYRLKNLANDVQLGPLAFIDTDLIAQKVVSSIYDGVTSTELDEEASRIAISMTENQAFGKLAARIVISNMHKKTKRKFSEVMELLYCEGILADDIISVVRQFQKELDGAIDDSRDYIFDYFGFKTLEKSYLMKAGKIVVERPQYLYMRVAVQLHKMDKNPEQIIETYNYLSKHFFTMASPVMFNSGTRTSNLSSCFLLGSKDSIKGIYKTISDCAEISKVGGGIGVHINDIRSKNTVIKGTNGFSDGIIPMLRVYNATCLYVNQCFTPDTWVYAKKGPKQMADVNCNDYLITIDGSFKKVNEIIVNHAQKTLLEVHSGNGLFPVRVTNEHELFLIKGQQAEHTSLDAIKWMLNKGLIQPDFYSASELTKEDIVGYPIPTYVLDNDINDLDYYMFYGIKVLNGKFETLDETFLHLPEIKILSLLEGLLLLGPVFTTTSQTLIMQVRYLLLRIGVLVTVTSTNGNNSISNNNDCCSTDGVCVSSSSNGDYGCSKHINCCHYSFRVPRHEKLLSIVRFKDAGNGVGNEPSLNYFEWNGTLWGRIEKIEKVEYSGDVYDFNMVDNHNYLTADMGLVHNSGKRKGSFAIYLSPEHPDIFDFLDLRKNQGSEDLRARDLFLAMWVSDLFMKQVESDGDWYLMDPFESPGLADTYGDAYEQLYWEYVSKKQFKRKVKAQEVWMKILESQIETGTPYILYKDQINKKSNQKNIGVVKSSNLCAEIALYSDDTEYAVCNLCSISLPKYVESGPDGLPFFNHELLYKVTKHIILPMNNIIDFNHYPIPEAKKSNMKHRPIGVGIQGLSDVFIKMKYPYESEKAKKLNKEISETIYFACLERSNELAQKDGPYSTFKGSPMSEGKLQFDLWNADSSSFSGRWDWETLKQKIQTFGVRNSTLTTCMPTASSAQIMGNTESFEPFDSCIFKRRVLSGEYIVANKYLVNDLTQLNLWNKTLKDTIIANNGSIQNIPGIPDDIKELYKTVWEIKMKNYIQMSADRGVFIDMTQSLNLFMAAPTAKKLTNMLFYTWKSGCKTGLYYLRTKAASTASKFTIDPAIENNAAYIQTTANTNACSLENREDCQMCSA